jgi:NTE family protein
MPYRAFLIFEGGGAKGITHVGAVEAIEQANLDIAGVAGASAGAIVAALVAVGYRATQLLDSSTIPVGPADIFRANRATPVSLLGLSNWIIFKVLFLWPSRWPILAAIMFLPPVAILLPFIGVALLLRPLGFHGPLAFIARLGFFETETASRFLDKVMQAALHSGIKTIIANEPVGTDGRRRLRFRHIDPANQWGGPLLKIAVTNVTTGRLEIIDSLHPDASVADTVIASMSIPFVFRPRRIDGLGRDDEFVDGGLVGNLPTWAFLEEKLSLERDQPNEPPIPIIAVSLSGPVEETLARPCLFSYIVRVLRTGIFGSQATVARFVPNILPIELKSCLPVIAFDCSREDALEARKAGYDQARAVLARRLTDEPARAVEQLARVRRAAYRRLRRLGVTKTQARTLRLAVLAPPEPENQSLRVVHSVNREADADWAMSYDLLAPGAPEAFRGRRSVFHDLTGGTPKQLRMTLPEFARMRRTLQSQLAAPILSQPVVAGGAVPLIEGVLLLDGDFSLEPLYKSNRDRTWLEARAIELASLARP